MSVINQIDSAIERGVLTEISVQKAIGTAFTIGLALRRSEYPEHLVL
ncbi:hypothetical protein VCR26J2_350161 [Vibrio coralliirubri]|nr:hypothetical protein VCR6J2_610014 [Vibrio coralliirubri]CDT67921.1 hypothetical protein VCR26J2_350161 [Vibrio coralliirubri]